MKSLVTGESTEVAQGESFDQGNSFEQGNQSVVENSVVSSLEGFSGQLVIPLPTGGALRLDWPMSFDYVIGQEPETEGTFTEVPSEGDDFADFTE
jgi:hypothetical protein